METQIAQLQAQVKELEEKAAKLEKMSAERGQMAIRFKRMYTSEKEKNDAINANGANVSILSFVMDNLPLILNLFVHLYRRLQRRSRAWRAALLNSNKRSKPWRPLWLSLKKKRKILSKESASLRRKRQRQSRKQRMPLLNIIISR